ncbi:trichohyalin-like isoform X2 [Anneissia japonica]|uniref:trichohyalin-like isoform X2 n=1 Tax=Anneissia japonica TaxID=1529436 RepID=UPI001425A041|nr:trichohyalin-like isoform X2 [Anneissia japonica]
MSEKVEPSDKTPVKGKLNDSVIANENNQEQIDNGSSHKLKMRKKKKEKIQNNVIDSNEDRTKLESNTGTDNGHTSEGTDTRTGSNHPGTDVDTGCSNGHPDQAAANTGIDKNANLETEIKKSEELKFRRGHKHQAQYKSNKSQEQQLDDRPNGSDASHMTSNDNNLDKSQRNVEKWEKKMVKKKQEYQDEKNNLEQKLQETKTKFEEELSPKRQINKYETDLSAKRQEYMNQLTDLQFDEQMQSITKRMEDLKELEDELDRRFKQCVDFEMEIEQAEKYLDRRGEICKSREEELKNLDEELENLHQELELDKETLEMSGVNVSEVLGSKRGTRFKKLSVLRRQSLEEDYIIKANLRRTQGDLKSTKQNLDLTTEKLDNLTEELNFLQSEKRKSDQKIKHLETQLAVALGQLTQRNPTQPKDQDRYKSVHKHITLNRLNDDGLLSINQQAQLRRKSIDRSSSSDGGRGSRSGTAHNISRLGSGLEPSTSNSRGSSEGSSSVIGDQNVGSTVSETGSISKSTTCNVM